jgi:nitroimidazol reductase NimA-like FMN-containing flavoprotein (pyridoxamine 5'-phosphate oxidase superfamily)
VKPLPNTVREFIDRAHVCRIATVRDDGEPHVIPVWPVFDGETTVFVDLGPKSTTARALEHDARIAVLIDEYDDDWSKLRKAILRCRAERVTGAEQDRVWDMIRAKYPQYTTVGWEPRLTMALHVYDWIEEGIVSASQ